MMDTSIWQPMVDRLDRLRAAGRRADFWLRDDDAVAPTAALDRLVDLADRFSVPITLAVIPAHTSGELSHYLASRDDISIAVHGWTHQNHAPPAEKRQELGGHRPREAVLDELDKGYSRLSALHPSSFVPLLVPPWNRIDLALLAGLPDIGFTALSVFGPERSPSNPDGAKTMKPGSIASAFPRPGLSLVNTHVDVMDWHGTRGCRDHREIIHDIVRRLDEMNLDEETVGILTHHLVHDESVWQFLSRLFELTAVHPACRWRRGGDLIAR
ncbi:MULTISPECIES: polysaccharide deacetylase family protein [unclassified Sinorhizobium]|uniref:polysaccharide deacetylase family protein n=1 Tax=unclassified Sinorhizobium TaxID=2613772 RepID=UPI0024C2A47B|nr:MULTISPECIES: polysaccharide deacetylase family protein [unclassified Sinorhizobium]MDK1374209.1 polysaccharide deacetylase family protein [Sinorhizobium sp. 6-70]MDK1480431.1 polysaccharide deacetylase family protein [Sinorhizobium sp. 6-117]